MTETDARVEAERALFASNMLTDMRADRMLRLNADEIAAVDIALDRLAERPAPVNVEHGPDWSDWQEGDGGDSCTCGYNGTSQECEASRAERPVPTPDNREALEYADHMDELADCLDHGFGIYAHAAATLIRDLVRPTPTREEWSNLMDAERIRQVEHGYDDAHDAEHGVKHLVNWAIDYARLGNTVAAATMMRQVLSLVVRPVPTEPCPHCDHRARITVKYNVRPPWGPCPLHASKRAALIPNRGEER